MLDGRMIKCSDGNNLIHSDCWLWTGLKLCLGRNYYYYCYYRCYYSYHYYYYIDDKATRIAIEVNNYQNLLVAIDNINSY